MAHWPRWIISVSILHAFFAVAVIAFELAASAWWCSGVLRWAGALALAGFTLLATLLALRFLGNGARHGPHDGDQRLLRASRPRWVLSSSSLQSISPREQANERFESPQEAASPPCTAQSLRFSGSPPVLGNTGSFMRDVASSWLMTDLSASPAAVAMVQAAGTLPIFLLAIPAGVLTDILDRRKFLIAVQLLLASVSISLMTFCPRPACFRSAP
jgi:hypothetical protein